jgi:hypothetical protein
MTFKRSPWDDFPSLFIHADERIVKNHPSYQAAKSGDPEAAVDLVKDLALLHNGARVLGGTVLTGKPYSAMLSSDEQQTIHLRAKHGPELEAWWINRFGFGYDCLTRSETRYLLNTPSAQRIRDQVAKAGETGNLTDRNGVS